MEAAELNRAKHTATDLLVSFQAKCPTGTGVMLIFFLWEARILRGKLHSHKNNLMKNHSK